MVGGTSTPEDLDVADAVARQLGLLIRLIQRSGRHPGQDGMDRASFQVLAHLATEGPQRASELAEAVCTDPSTVSRRVAALVKAGLLERRADPDDGRASLLAATSEGTRALELSRRRRAEVIASAMTDWPSQERRKLADLLGRFVTDFQHHEPPAAPERRNGGGI
ncbi:MarR family winged helix-turn-helix transcriptional regulator [Pseudonocardia bannensis]|uniref:MarR family transcriptional regulator n=1 Tax=Pseudonocardia bannensis TaxID=630973 RepID=A0A848DMG2_9PSEU|nr:MarR family transcriptional regulator [Pseudonocardia bannensis]NMH93957.1 MarR family transcriptional regulator [Pseudonocardia bannensis]